MHPVDVEEHEESEMTPESKSKEKKVRDCNFLLLFKHLFGHNQR